MHRLTTAVLALGTITVILLPTPARADGPWGEVDCSRTPSAPQCTLTVTDPGGDDAPAGKQSAARSPTCSIAGRPVDCYTEGYGWLGAGGCYYGKDPGGYMPDHEYIKTCYDPTVDDFTPAGTVWLAEPPAGIAVLAQRAVSYLRFPKPVIAASPHLDSPQVVRVPVWWWIPSSTWTTQTATASLPGITFTAHATPQRITWDAGDGTTTVCTGPGTPWTAAYAPGSPSPTCGHTYTRSSRNAPGGRFTLRATITWTITWQGAGMTGTEPAVTTAATSAVEVREVHALIRA